MARTLCSPTTMRDHPLYRLILETPPARFLEILQLNCKDKVCI